MAITLPLKVAGWPAIRIITKPTWSSKAGWTEQPMGQMAPRPVLRLGFEFLRCRRTTIDADGYAVFRFVIGRMDGREYADGFPDLNLHEVRILAQDADGNWATIWWGTVEQQLDTAMAPGADYTYGTREYHCLDGIAGRMRHWVIDRHGVYVSGGTQRPASSSQSPCLGHPGFNAVRWDGRITGTRESSSAVYDPWGDLSSTALQGKAYYHTFAGDGKLFTDRQALETAIVESRPAGEVPFYLDPTGCVEFLSCYSVWKIERGMTMLEFLRRVLRRQRGRGIAFCAWEESGDPLSGTFTPKISIYPPNLDSIVYTPKGLDPNTGTEYDELTLRGATNFGSEITIDLIGDHRLGPNAESTFELGDRAAYVVNYLETEGERIEVVITGAFNDTVPTVEKRWEDTQADAFKVATEVERARVKYESIYQLYGLARDWGGKAWDGNAGSSTSQMTRADFRCDDDGEIVVPLSSDVGDTSALVVEVMRDLPLYAEYDYTQTYPSPRYDALTSDPIPPTRRAPLLMARTSTTDTGRFLPLAPTPPDTIQALYTTTFYISDFGISVQIPGDTANGVRTIGDMAASPSIGSAINYTDLVFTLGLRLPHRVRFATAGNDANGVAYTKDNAPRRKVVTVRDHHLWLGHVSAIWEFDPSSYSNGGYQPKRGPANASDTVPGIIRDDRGALEQIHRLSWLWFGSIHRTAAWEMAACGLLPSFAYGEDGELTGTFPRLGQLPSTISAAGEDHDIATPITVVDYDHIKCMTRWATDWSDLDMR